jgi:hypothetical protein
MTLRMFRIFSAVTIAMITGGSAFAAGRMGDECPQGRQIRTQKSYPSTMTDCEVLDADTAAENQKLQRRPAGAPNQTNRPPAVTTYPTIQQPTDVGSASASPPFAVTIEASVSGGARPLVTGKTNLPDGTQLSIHLNKPWRPDGKERLAAGLPACVGVDCNWLQTNSSVVVKNGQFSDGPFTDNGDPLSPGTYILDVWNLFAGSGQPPEVLAILGQHGENLYGPLVNACCVGYHFGWPERLRQEAMEKERSSHDKAAREGDPYNTILYQRFVVVGPTAQPSVSHFAIDGNNPLPPGHAPTAREIEEAKRKIAEGVGSRAQHGPASGSASESASGQSAVVWYGNRAAALGRNSTLANIASANSVLGSDDVDVNDPGWIRIESKGEVSAIIDTRSVRHDADGNAHASTCLILHGACLKVFKQLWLYNCHDHTYSWIDTSILPSLPHKMDYAEPTSVADKLISIACR